MPLSLCHGQDDVSLPGALRDGERVTCEPLWVAVLCFGSSLRLVFLAGPNLLRSHNNLLRQILGARAPAWVFEDGAELRTVQFYSPTGICPSARPASGYSH